VTAVGPALVGSLAVANLANAADNLSGASSMWGGLAGGAERLADLRRRQVLVGTRRSLLPGFLSSV